MSVLPLVDHPRSHGLGRAHQATGLCRASSGPLLLRADQGRPDIIGLAHHSCQGLLHLPHDLRVGQLLLDSLDVRDEWKLQRDDAIGYAALSTASQQGPELEAPSRVSQGLYEVSPLDVEGRLGARRYRH